MIDYRSLEALAAVVEYRGFERAAQRLNISQSAVSQRIRQLEYRLGQPVLLRTAPPRLTDLGQRLTNHLQLVQQLEQSLVLPLEDEASVRIRLAVNADTLDSWLAGALLNCDEYERMDFELVVEDQDVGLKRMRNGEVMACVCASPAPVNGGLCQPLGIMRYRALASPAFLQRFNINARTRKKPGVLAALPALIFSSDDRLQHRFLQTVSPADPEPLRTHFCPSAGGFVHMTMAGIGYGMIPQIMVAAQLADKTLVDVVPGFHLDVPLYWHYWQTESRMMKQLRHSAVTVARQQLLPLA